MKSLKTSFILLFILALVFLPTQNAHASGLLDGRVVFGDNFTLKSGQTMTGDLVVIGGNAVVEEDATVSGDLVVVGGTLTLDGTVEGDSAIIGGSANLGSTAVIEGDLVTVGGSVKQDPQAQVKGQVVTNVPAPDIQIPGVPVIPSLTIPPQPDFSFHFNPFTRAMQVLFTAIALALLAMLASLFLQPQLERVSQAMAGQPVVTGSFGLLTVVLLPFAVLTLIITLLLIPVAILVVIAAPFAWLFGVIALGTEVGERFTRAISQSWAPALTAGFGTFLLMLVSGGIGMIPCVGWLIPFIIALLGIGGVVVTIFGTRPYPRVVAPLAVTGGGDEPVG